jgi:RTA1 like protein
MASGNVHSLHIGEHIIIGGLIVQLLFFGLFIFTTLKFHFGMKNNPNRKVLTQRPPWERHIWALYGGSLLILIRSIFRLIEYAQGNAGYLVSHEAYMYIFDGSLMFLSMVVFLWIHPSEINALLNPRASGKAVRRVFSVYTLHQFIPN